MYFLASLVSASLRDSSYETGIQSASYPGALRFVHLVDHTGVCETPNPFPQAFALHLVF